MTNRREFIVQLSLGGTALVAGGAAMAAAVTEADPLAVSMGYKADAAKADKVKFPKFAAGQNCSGCALYTGKAGAAAGPCSLFANKDVSAKGWCSAFAKKA